MSTHRGLPVSQLTEFVGRAAELGELRTLVATRRLVTITGQAGVGKSRTAARLAEILRRSYGESTARVAAKCATPRDLIELIAETVGARGATAGDIARSLGDKPFLLILDGIENPQATATVIEQLLERTTETHIVVTSCERTGIRGEMPYPLPPLAVPAASPLAQTAGAPGSTETEDLLVQRVLDADPDFTVTDAAIEDFLAVCRSTDGLPRFIEAAARAVTVLGLHEAAVAVTERPTVLDSFLPYGSSAQASAVVLDAAIARVSPDARAFMQRLSLLESGCDVRFAAELFSAGSLATLALPVAELVGASLVRSENVDGERRLRVPLHYRARLIEVWPSEERSHEEQHIRQVLIARLRHCAAVWFSGEQLSAVQFLNRHAADITRMLGAMAAEQGSAHEALEIISALRYYWQLHPVDPWPRARDWLHSALSLVDLKDVVTLRAIQTDAYIAYHEGDLDGARARLKAIDAEFEPGIAEYADELFGVFVAALVDVADGRVEEAEPKLSAALDAVLEAEVRDHVGEKYWHLAACQIVLNKQDAALQTVTDGVAYCDRIGDVWGRAYLWCLLAIIEDRDCDSTAAGERVRAALDVMARFGDRVGLGLCVQLLASIRTEASQGADLTSLNEFVPQATPLRPDALTGFSGNSGWLSHPAALPDGRQLGEVLTRLTARDAPMSSMPDRTDACDALSARETEIAVLIAEGLGNPAIAARLVLSRRTVEGHVQRILAKLGFRSRSQIAVWVTKNVDSVAGRKG
ncbi:LuxR C-terminal-related transcriptional regulator [Mycolicibacterium sp. 141076]|uniref:ATP-binding protein n=1 Tax=Mycobacteriaceae TaxID=1762 RepID=UPI00299E76C7|nr:LuxR C-terminal-related transcriptional regulator [Mycolicibacterium sp. 141076]MDX1881594.1 LuxR C-terminal-related transcriptional regulator [Mycolicibacterium sp. 141076]